MLMHVLKLFSKKFQAQDRPDLQTYRHLWDSSWSEVRNAEKSKNKTNASKTSKQFSISLMWTRHENKTLKLIKYI